MSRWGVALFIIGCALVGLVAAIVLQSTGAWAADSVFSVTDPQRGLYRMHPALLVGEVGAHV